MTPTLRKILLSGNTSPSLDLNFRDGIYSWNGQSRQFSDLTVVAGTPSFNSIGLIFDGILKMQVPSMNWFNPFSGTFEIEATNTDTVANVQGSTFFSLLGAGNTRTEFICAPSPNPYTTQLYDTSVGQISLQAASATTPESGATGKFLVSYSPGVKVSTSSTGAAQQGNGSAYAGSSKSTCAIGYRAFGGGHPFTGVIRRIRYWPRAKGLSWVQSEALKTDFTNIHMLGDSFCSDELSYDLSTQYAGEYRVNTNDGVGGSTLADQLTRFTATPQYWDRTLIIMDGGLSDTTAAAKAAVDGMVALIGHDRWFYTQPGIGASITIGTQANTDWHTAQDELLAYFGSAHYIPTLSAAWAAGDGSANDNTDIANGIWPRSLRTASGVTDTLHPGPTGKVMLATQMYSKIVAAGI